MKGGGLTWLGWLMVGSGAVLVYAGMTGQSVVADVSAVLSGKHATGSGQSASSGTGYTPGGGSNNSANATEHDLSGGGGGSTASANAAEEALNLSAQSAARSLVPHPVVGGFQVATP